jgi:hypothetical protein
LGRRALYGGACGDGACGGSLGRIDTNEHNHDGRIER